MDKKSLRSLYLQKRQDYIQGQKSLLDEIFLDNFISSDFYRDSQDIFIFVSFNDEINTHSIIKKALDDKKNIYVPFIQEKTREMEVCRLRDFKHLRPGAYDILAPSQEDLDLVDPSRLDLIVLPGLTFSPDGYRIGYGGGYYDRFLAKLDINIRKLGIAYDIQVGDKMVRDSYDLPVDFILTDRRLINCQAGLVDFL